MKKLRTMIATAIIGMALLTACEDAQFEELSTDVELMDVQATDDEDESEDIPVNTGGGSGSGTGG